MGLSSSQPTANKPSEVKQASHPPPEQYFESDFWQAATAIPASSDLNAHATPSASTFVKELHNDLNLNGTIPQFERPCPLISGPLTNWSLLTPDFVKSAFLPLAAMLYGDLNTYMTAIDDCSKVDLPLFGFNFFLFGPCFLTNPRLIFHTAVPFFQLIVNDPQNPHEMRKIPQNDFARVHHRLLLQSHFWTTLFSHGNIMVADPNRWFQTARLFKHSSSWTSLPFALQKGLLWFFNQLPHYNNQLPTSPYPFSNTSSPHQYREVPFHETFLSYLITTLFWAAFYETIEFDPNLMTTPHDTSSSESHNTQEDVSGDDVNVKQVKYLRMFESPEEFHTTFKAHLNAIIDQYHPFVTFPAGINSEEWLHWLRTGGEAPLEEKTDEDKNRTENDQNDQNNHRNLCDFGPQLPEPIDVVELVEITTAIADQEANQEDNNETQVDENDADRGIENDAQNAALPPATTLPKQLLNLIVGYTLQLPPLFPPINSVMNPLASLVPRSKVQSRHDKFTFSPKSFSLDPNAESTLKHLNNKGLVAKSTNDDVIKKQRVMPMPNREDNLLMKSKQWSYESLALHYFLWFPAIYPLIIKHQFQLLLDGVEFPSSTNIYEWDTKNKLKIGRSPYFDGPLFSGSDQNHDNSEISDEDAEKSQEQLLGELVMSLGLDIDYKSPDIPATDIGTEEVDRIWWEKARKDLRQKEIKGYHSDKKAAALEANLDLLEKAYSKSNKTTHQGPMVSRVESFDNLPYIDYGTDHVEARTKALREAFPNFKRIIPSQWPYQGLDYNIFFESLIHVLSAKPTTLAPSFTIDDINSMGLEEFAKMFHHHVTFAESNWQIELQSFHSRNSIFSQLYAQIKDQLIVMSFAEMFASMEHSPRPSTENIQPTDGCFLGAMIHHDAEIQSYKPGEKPKLVQKLVGDKITIDDIYASMGYDPKGKRLTPEEMKEAELESQKKLKEMEKKQRKFFKALKTNPYDRPIFYFQTTRTTSWPSLYAHLFLDASVDDYYMMINGLKVVVNDVGSNQERTVDLLYPSQKWFENDIYPFRSKPQIVSDGFRTWKVWFPTETTTQMQVFIKAILRRVDVNILTLFLINIHEKELYFKNQEFVIEFGFDLEALGLKPNDTVKPYKCKLNLLDICDIAQIQLYAPEFIETIQHVLKGEDQ